MKHLIRQFDENGNGKLDQAEFEELLGKFG